MKIISTRKRMSRKIKSLKEKIRELYRLIEELRKNNNLSEEKAGKLKSDLETSQNIIIGLKNEKKSKAQTDLEFLEKQNLLFKSAREEILLLQEEIKRMKSDPSLYSTFLEFSKNHPGKADVLSDGSRCRVNISPKIKADELKNGCRVIVIGGSIVEVFSEYDNGVEAKITAILSESRVKISIEGAANYIARISSLLKDAKLKIGDPVMFDSKTGFIYEVLPKSGAEEVDLEETPNVSYEDIGGLDEEIAKIKSKIEQPFSQPEIYERYKRDVIKGLVLYGAPGCGKTMIAKAIANALAKKAQEKYGKEIKARFFNIKGPELSTMWVGETERKIREIFQKARDLAKEDMPVVIFFDEADSFLARRGSRKSSDVNQDYVTMFNAEVDGVESLSNIIIILATNRVDLLDPAVLRPGRLDLKIRVKQPNEQGAKQVFKKYITSNLPFDQKYYDPSEYPDLNKDPNLICQYLIDGAARRIYSDKEENKFLVIEFQSGRKEILRFKDFISGAAIKNIIDRTKDKAINEEVTSKTTGGIRLKHLYEAIEEEFKENEDLPSTVDALNEWAKVKGIKEEIVSYKFLVGSKDEKDDEDNNII